MRGTHKKSRGTDGAATGWLQLSGRSLSLILDLLMNFTLQALCVAMRFFLQLPLKHTKAFKMKLPIAIFVTILGFSTSYAFAIQSNLTLQEIKSLQNCTFTSVAKKMKFDSVVDANAPKVYFSEEISIDFFQNEIFKFWKFKPEVILNSYNAVTNAIFLYTGSDRYKLPRTALDSLAHEFTHYFQFEKSGRDLESIASEDDKNEAEAVQIQEWYRDTNPCQARLQVF